MKEDDTTTTATTTATNTTNNSSSSSDVMGETQDSEITCCSAPGCSQAGINKCGGCKTTFYCGSACQTADWPHHKSTCEGRKQKVGKTNNKVKEDDSINKNITTTTNNNNNNNNSSSSSSEVELIPDPVLIVCSASECTQPGTNKCGGCKTSFYCCAKCQKADWPIHKDTCEGQLRKVGTLHLDKAKGFLQEQNWPQALLCSNITLAKLNVLNERPMEEIAEALGVKVHALNGLNMVEQELETLECAREWHAILTTKHASIHPSTLNAGFYVIERWVCMSTNHLSQKSLLLIIVSTHLKLLLQFVN